MGWANIAVISAAVHGVVNIVDSHLLAKRMPGLEAFLLPVGVISLIYSGVLFVLFPLPQGNSMLTLVVALASGILRAAAVTIMLYTMRREEVVRVIPVVQTYPVFVALMAVPLLGESLVYLEWLAIFMVVAGAIMVSVRQGPSGTGNRLGKSFGLLFGSSLLMAVANIATKYVLAEISFWNIYWLSAFCMSLFFLLVSVRPGVFNQLKLMKRRSSIMVLLTFNEILALTSAVLSFWAIENGPVSLVSTIVSTRPIFVFIYALVLHRVFPAFIEWQASKTILMLRLIATAMIVGGIIAIRLV
jgi:drug/metabolite transporter (DMT)-like permease